MWGVIAAIAGTGFVALLFLLLGAEAVAALPALVLKVAYGALLGACVTRLSLRALLR